MLFSKLGTLTPDKPHSLFVRLLLRDLLSIAVVRVRVRVGARVSGGVGSFPQLEDVDVKRLACLGHHQVQVQGPFKESYDNNNNNNSVTQRVERTAAAAAAVK